MKRGTKPRAPEVQEQRGAYKKNPSRRNESAPTANGIAPTPPSYLTDEESRKWDELCADLRKMGILSSELREMLTAYCTSYGSWRRTQRAIKRTGYLITTTDRQGNKLTKPNPVCREMHRHRNEMNRLLPEFGLTPASRSGLTSMKPPAEENPVASWLQRFGDN